MKEIVIASKERKPDDALVRCVKMLFPDCNVRVVCNRDRSGMTTGNRSQRLVQARNGIQGR
jgi:hypothetical protein